MKSFFKEKLNSKTALIIIIGAFCVGFFNEGVCAFAGVVLSVLLLIKLFGSNRIIIEKSLVSVTVAIACFGFLIVSIWGYDKFNSLLGFIKFFPLLLYWLIMCQEGREEGEKALFVVPYAGAVMTLISLPLSYITPVKDYFSVKGRLSGFFQYPSTFALFLIIGIIIIACEGRFSFIKVAVAAILMLGIFMSGSRTSFIVFALSVVGIVLISENKKLKLTLLSVFVLLVVTAVIIHFAAGKSSPFTRFLTISSTSVTLKGRLLYIKDAIRFILKHPFGIGYMGYYFAQGSFQTGLYSNTFVHNELLQIMIDIGWIPGIAVAVCVVKAIISKNITPFKKLIIAAIFLHSMLDFDLQYLVIGFIALTCMYEGENNIEVKTNSAVKTVVAALLAVICITGLYLGSSSLMYQLGKSDTAVKICKYNTMAQLDFLRYGDEVDELNGVADTVIKNNKHVSNAYSVKALCAYSEGDVEQTIEYKKKAIECNRYFQDEYTDFAGMLVSAAQLYAEQEDYDSAQYCLDELVELNNTIDEVNSSTDKLAYDLPDSPEISLPDEYKSFIEEAE